MATYRVTWEIDLDADSPLEAARKAQGYLIDPQSSASIFDVISHDDEEPQTSRFITPNAPKGLTRVDLYEGTISTIIE